MDTDTTEVVRSPTVAPAPAAGDLPARSAAAQGAVPDESRGGPEPAGSLDALPGWERSSVWRARWFQDTVLSEERLATMPGPLITLVVGALYLVLGSAVVWTGDLSETAAGFWPPAGVALAGLLLLPVRRWGWVALAIVAPNGAVMLSGSVPISAAALWAVANCLEPVLGAAALRAFRSSRWLTPGRLLALFLSAAVIGAPMVAGVVGTIGTVDAYGRPWLSVWLEWIAGDGLGVLVTVPLLVTYTTRRPAPRTAVESGVLLGVLVTITAMCFLSLGADGARLLPYLILVLLIWAGMRFGTTVAAFVGFVIGVTANVASLSGQGPFASVDGETETLTLQIFLGIAIVMSFVVAALASDLADRTEVNRLLNEQATHDALTGLPNRVLFQRHLHHALQSRAEAGAVAVILVDLDDFKKINDRHGHPVGDDVLRMVARRLSGGVRRTNLLCRLAGDEFVVLCTGLPDASAAGPIASGMLDVFDDAVVVAGMQFKMTATIGIATAVAHDESTPSDIMRRAEIALHRSKQVDGPPISTFDDELEARTRRETGLAEELQLAIARRELTVLYQPVVELRTGCVGSAEALLRWNSPRFGSVGPAEFIPIAENAGLIRELGDWVLTTACTDAVAWRASAVGATRKVAVNVSAHQVGDEAFPDRVRRTLQLTTLPADALILEITETAVMDDFDRSVVVLAELRRIGVQLSMDDFGTGYSSMTYLRHIPVNTLKLDRSFVSGLGTAREDAVIVESLINLGHAFDLEVVAEGVETAEQLDHLVRLGCDHGQGFLWSPAVDAATAGTLLPSRSSAGLQPGIHDPPRPVGPNRPDRTDLGGQERTGALSARMVAQGTVAPPDAAVP